MKFPTPEDSGSSPVWENYVVAQAVQATLGRAPRNAIAIGVRQEGVEVFLQFQLRSVSAQDIEDMDDIVFELELLLGPDVKVSHTHELRKGYKISPNDGFRWIYLRRMRALRERVALAAWKRTDRSPE